LLAAALLVVHVAAAALLIHRANRETAALDGEIAQVFSQAMPAEAMHDPRRQMQSRLERVRHSGAGPEYFLRSLEALSSAVSAMPNTIIDTLSYREQILELKVTAPSLAALSQLSQLVGKQGLTAEIQSSTPAGAAVEAHLQVRSAAAKTPR
jgi:type II secretion system protein L